LTCLCHSLNKPVLYGNKRCSGLPWLFLFPAFEALLGAGRDLDTRLGQGCVHCCTGARAPGPLWTELGNLCVYTYARVYTCVWLCVYLCAWNTHFQFQSHISGFFLSSKIPFAPLQPPVFTYLFDVATLPLVLMTLAHALSPLSLATSLLPSPMTLARSLVHTFMPLLQCGFPVSITSPSGPLADSSMPGREGKEGVLDHFGCCNGTEPTALSRLFF
jgi:hypothetical protein